MSKLRIIGIDPGSVRTGYGIIETDGRRSEHVAHGCIATQGKDFSARLGQIFAGLREVLQQWQPQEMAVEQVFLNKNVMSALKLGQARGAAICAAHGYDMVIAEYTPRLVKQAVVGTGAADKSQVQHMVGVLLNLKINFQADAADALALALCHAHSRQLPSSVQLPLRKRRRR